MDWFLKLLGLSSKQRRLVSKGMKAVQPKEPKAQEERSSPPREARQKIVEIEDLPYEQYEIVGEASYQAELERTAGPKTEQGVDVRCEILLVCESGNRHDRLAVRVDLNGETVGYLARDDARAFRQMLAEEGERGAEVRAPAVITGGWRRPNSEGHFGIALDLD
jgi:hypothetical protein